MRSCGRTSAAYAAWSPAAARAASDDSSSRAHRGSGSSNGYSDAMLPLLHHERAKLTV